MKRLPAKLLAAAFAAALALAPASDAFARGGFRGGGFRVSPSLRSLGSPRTLRSLPASPNWGSATKPALKASPADGAPSAAPRFGAIGGQRSSLSSQRGLYNSASRNGTLFSSKAEASAAFRSRYAKDYGSTFASEPAARPGYIPSAASVGGQNVNIVYNSGLGGYGYLHPLLGTWILYDALSDAAMADSLMYGRGYYWGGAPVYMSHGSGFISLAFVVLLLFLVAAIAVGIMARRGAARFAQRGDDDYRERR